METLFSLRSWNYAWFGFMTKCHGKLSHLYLARSATQNLEIATSAADKLSSSIWLGLTLVWKWRHRNM